MKRRTLAVRNMRNYGRRYRLKKAERMLRSRHAAETRELEDTLTTYANQIQVLALRNAEWEAETARLVEQLRQAGGSVSALPSAERPPSSVPTPRHSPG
ncbi:hypothetical protein [Streptomyces sp. SBT349]|uniref:hypothetical protein n=1 Tax=Streptomyces sp. SBT349 TaxID=1580539 RepID=UPI00066E5B03|nr:hypothetical protein [Streptomyces sp. SBT349]